MSRRDDLDIDDTLHTVRDFLWTADANITAAERMVGEPGGGIEATDEDGEHDEGDYGHGDDNDPGRRRNHLAEYLEATKLAVRAAQYAHDRTIAKFDSYCASSDRAVETVETTAIAKRRGKA